MMNRRQMDCNYVVHQVYISDKDKDFNTQSAVNFTVTLPTELKRVVAVRPLNSVFYENASEIAQVELGGVQIPVRVSTGQGLFVYLNGYDTIHSGKSKNVPIFARIQGEDNFPIVKNFWMDPYCHILNPMEPKLKRFDVKIYNGDYDIYSPATPQNAGFNMLLAVYCEANNCDMS